MSTNITRNCPLCGVENPQSEADHTYPCRPQRGPESLGTIWVCTNCLMHHANGECGCCHDDCNHEGFEPLSAIEAPQRVAMGMAYLEHTEGCLRRALRGDTPSDYECDCETDTYSTSQCEGCGSHLHGERHAMTLFNG